MTNESLREWIKSRGWGHFLTNQSNPNSKLKLQKKILVIPIWGRGIGWVRGSRRKQLCVILFFKSTVKEIIDVEDVTHVLNVL